MVTQLTALRELEFRPATMAYPIRKNTLMKFHVCIFIGIITASFQPAYGSLKVQGQKSVKLPRCVGQRAIEVLNRAIYSVDQAKPIRIETIDDGHQTNFALHGTRACAGSLTSLGGFQYIGTWSYTLTGDSEIAVEFSLQPSK